MKSAIAQRAARKRSNSLHTIPPPESSSDYDRAYADIAASILYKSPCPSQAGLPVFILNAAAFPDSYIVDYDSLLPYVLARLPGEDDLIAGTEYEVIFFAGGQPESVTGDKKNGPGISWYIQVYQVLSRALRKRLQKIYIVHERSWVRVLTEILGAIASPKFKRKVFHVSSLSALAMHIPIEGLLIPPAVYLHDRKLVPDIYVPYSTGARAFAASQPLPQDSSGNMRLPRVLRETTSFLLQGPNLATEGVFRISAHATLQGVLREAYDRGQRFIVWRELRTLQVDPGMDPQTLAEVHESDAYGVYLAAGLMKTWYRELKTPIFPENTYSYLREHFGSPDAEISLEDLSFLSPNDQTSILPHASRLILTWHLLPLLDIVASYQASNKMSPDNLAVCFAPALICGADQLQDAKMTSVLRRVISAAVSHWSDGLSAICGTNDDEFHARLSAPADPQDYEDPLRDDQARRMSRVTDQMAATSFSNGEMTQVAPALPPRSSSLAGNREQEGRKASPIPKRKPAPVVSSLPRYSTLMSSASLMDNAPAYSAVDEKRRLADEQNGFLPEKSERSQSVQINEPEDNTLDLNRPKRSATIATAQPTSASSVKPPSPLLSPSLAEIQSAQLRSVSGASTNSAASNDDIFIKPTWAASSRKGSASSAISARKPTPPLHIAKHTPFPIDQPSNTTAGAGGSRIDSGATQPTSGYAPKPRAPSPGLMQRMKSWESQASGGEGEGRGRGEVGERKQSVDDLKKLYEDRAGVAASVGGLVRSRSNASARSDT